MTKQNGDARQKVTAVVTEVGINTKCEHNSAKLQQENHLLGLVMYLLEVILDRIKFDTNAIENN